MAAAHCMRYSVCWGTLIQKQLKDKADQEYQQKYGGMERAAEVDYLYFGGENAGGGDEEASGEGMEGETLFFN